MNILAFRDNGRPFVVATLMAMMHGEFVTYWAFQIRKKDDLSPCQFDMYLIRKQCQQL